MDLKTFKSLRKGDIIKWRGNPHKYTVGSLSEDKLSITELTYDGEYTVGELPYPFEKICEDIYLFKRNKISWKSRLI